eukprot:678488-Prorocentrum_minimum.AAC.1
MSSVSSYSSSQLWSRSSLCSAAALFRFRSSKHVSTPSPPPCPSPDSAPSRSQLGPPPITLLSSPSAGKVPPEGPALLSPS